MALHADGISEIQALAGRDLGHSQWHDITQEQIDAFADVSGDHQWIHTDAERARTGPFGATIAHGFMTLSWGVPLANELLTITGVRMALNYGLNRVRFPSPVVVGSRVRLHFEVASVSEVPNGGVEMARSFTFDIEGATKPACVAESLTRYYA